MNKIAIYCRLSKEDGNNESLSIINQKKILKEYVEKNLSSNYSYYIDDGYSGTNFNRPSFKKMINDINDGKINVVVVKDLSRLGRNYIHVGLLTEDYFVKKNVRFIAINDGYDSNLENEFAPFKNIINEWYAKDISKKVRFTLDDIAKKGQSRKTAFPLYGYCYNKNNDRIIDEESSEVVRKIYEVYLNTKSIEKVKSYLLENKIYTPGYYNYLKYGYNHNKYQEYGQKRYHWLNQTIHDILSNFEYLGNFITKKTKSLSYKMSYRTKTEDSERYVFKDKYPRIISDEVFYEVSKILSLNKREIYKDNNYQGLLYCGSCGKRLTYQKNRNRFYCCNKSCSNKVYILSSVIEDVLKVQINSIKEKIINIPIERLEMYTCLNKDLSKIEKRNEELKRNMLRLIESNVELEEFKDVIENYKDEYNKNTKLIEKIKKNNIEKIKDNLKSINLFDYLSSIIYKINVSRKDKIGNKVFREIEIILYKIF